MGQHPANGQRVGSRRIPERCACGDFELAFGSSIPVDAECLPLRFRVAQHGTQVRESLPHHAGPSLLMWFRRRWGSKQTSIEAQRCNKADPLLDAPQAQFNDTVCPIADDGNRDAGKPATDNHHHLLCKTSQGLMSLAQGCAHLWGGGQHTRSRARPTATWSRARSRPRPSSPNVSRSYSLIAPYSTANYRANAHVC